VRLAGTNGPFGATEIVRLKSRCLLLSGADSPLAGRPPCQLVGSCSACALLVLCDYACSMKLDAIRAVTTASTVKPSTINMTAVARPAVVTG
jgi:hypothetical protein